MKRRKKWLAGIFAGLAMSLLISLINTPTVYAGDINSAEAMIVSYYNGTFQYQGKTYVATEEAKAAAYNKLVQDGVDLTASEARSAIAQANSQIADGIAQGILVEVDQSQNEGENDGKADSDNQSGEKQEGNAASSDTNPSSKGDTSKEQTNHKSENKTKKQNTDAIKTEEKKSDTQSSIEKVDVEKMIQEISEEKTAGTIVRQKGDNYQILDFETGMQMTVSPDGTVLSRSEIPLKTKSITAGGGLSRMWILFIAVSVLLIVFGIFLAASRKKNNHREKRYKNLRTLYSVAVSVVVCACMVLFFTDLGLYVLFAGVTEVEVLTVMGLCLLLVVVLGSLLWVQYHYKHRAMRYLAYSMAAATVINGSITILLCRKQWMDQRGFLLIGVEALLTLVCFRLVSLIKQKSR